MKRMKLTTAGRVVIFVIALVILAGVGGFGFNYYKNNIAPNQSAASTPNNPAVTPSSSGTQNPTTSPSAGSTNTSSQVINLSLDEWIGYKSIIDANGGLQTAPGSLIDQQGIKVNISVINDPTISSNAIITGDIDGAGYTVNRTAFLSGKFQSAGLDIVMPFLTNYSNGGDGIVAKSGINSVEDLVGKRVGAPRFGESQAMIVWLVNHSNLSQSDKDSIVNKIILFDDAAAAGEAFFAGQLDAAGTWQPYLSYAASESDSHILFSTVSSRSLILSGVIFREDFAKANSDTITKFINAVLQANSMYSTNFSYIRDAMPMFAELTDDEIAEQCKDAQLMGYSDNVDVLGGTAKTVYSDMCDIWEQLGEDINRDIESSLFDLSYIQKLSGEYADDVATAPSAPSVAEMTEAEKQEIIQDYQAIMTQTATVEFVPDSSVFLNPDNAHAILNEFVKSAMLLDGSIIQIEGNINASTYSESGVALSLKRAQTVADYLVEQGIDPNRLIVVGNGNTKMLVDPGSKDASLNRRTDVLFKIVEE